jgi:lambda repressor-like predicted transcriptional regulator
MTEARRKTKILLLQQKKTFAQLANECGLAEATIHNVLDGQSGSQKSKQAITNALGAEVWDDVPVTKRRLQIPKGTEIQFAEEFTAEQAQREFINCVKREGRTVIFTGPVVTAVTFDVEEKAGRNAP